MRETQHALRPRIGPASHHDLEPHRVPCEFVRAIDWSAPELGTSKNKMLGFFTSCCGIFFLLACSSEDNIGFFVGCYGRRCPVVVQRFTAVTGMPES